MIDISEKENVDRIATAYGEIVLKKETLIAIEEKTVKKGDVMEVSKISGINAAKMTFMNIPHCHPIPISFVDPVVEIGEDRVSVRCTVKANYKTGVEMEALSCVSSMLLTIWDMVKYLEKDVNGIYRDTRITNIKVIEKRKGKDGSSQ